MAIERETVEAVASLARIDLGSLPEAERAGVAGHLSRVLEWVHLLNEVDVTDVEPMKHPVHLSTAFREDVAREGLGVAAVLANTTHQDGASFLVPQVVEEGSDE